MKVEGVVDGGMDIEEALGRCRGRGPSAPRHRTAPGVNPIGEGGKPPQLDASVVG